MGYITMTTSLELPEHENALEVARGVRKFGAICEVQDGLNVRWRGFGGLAQNAQWVC